MKQIKKEDLKEVIRLTKKWCEDIHDDAEYQELCEELYNELYQARVKAFGEAYTPYNAVVICVVLLKDEKITLETCYKVFEALGYELV